MPAYVQHDLGECVAGSAVEVTPEQDGNVYLVDERNLGLYRRGRRFTALGGAAAAGVPFRLGVIEDGRWFVVLDLNGVRGRIRASVRRLDAAELAAAAGPARPSVTAEQLLR